MQSLDFQPGELLQTRVPAFVFSSEGVSAPLGRLDKGCYVIFLDPARFRSTECRCLTVYGVGYINLKEVKAT